MTSHSLANILLREHKFQATAAATYYDHLQTGSFRLQQPKLLHVDKLRLMQSKLTET